MVYPGHRSSGCLRCIQRKVKCDELKPGCARCRKRKETCPGYAREKFKFETDSDKAGRGSSGSSQKSETSTEDSRSSDSPRNSPKSSQLTRPWDEESVCWYFRQYVIPQNRLQGGGWFGFLPEMYSEAPEDSCLRWAVRAAALAGFANSTGLTHLAAQARQIYGTTLMNLKLVLNNEVKAKDDETMVSILMLIIFEVITFERNPIENHLEGLMALMQLREPGQLMSNRTRTVHRLVHSHVQMSCLAQKRRYSYSIIEAELSSFPLLAKPEDRAPEKFLMIYKAVEFCAAATDLTLVMHEDQEAQVKLRKLMKEALLLDSLLEHRAENLGWSHHTGQREFDGEVHTTYNFIMSPIIWNLFRVTRIIIHETLMRCAVALEMDNVASEASPTAQSLIDVSKSVEIIQELASEICSSIAFCMGDIDSNGEPTASIHKDGKAASCYLLMWPLRAVKLANYTTEAQRKKASSALERIGREVGIKQAFFMLRPRDSPFEL